MEIYGQPLAHTMGFGATRNLQKRTETEHGNAFSLPGTLPEPSRTFMDCDVFVAGMFLLPVSLPGTFPGLHGLRFFLTCVSETVCTFPVPFPEPSRTFMDCSILEKFGKVSVCGVTVP